MSQRFDEFEERLSEYESQIDTVYRLYHIPVLAALMLFMFWIRVRNYTDNIGQNGEPLYRGNDPYYHLRSTNFVIENYPFTMPFDPWTGFAAGHRTGQFGTIYDQFVATVALVVGLGSPSQETVVMTTLFVAPVLATLSAIPMYYIGKRLGGRFGGIIGVVVLAITPGQFLTRSVAGFYDHHVAEVFLTLLVLAAAMKFLAVAQREGAIYEFIRTREFGLLREPVKWGLVLGVLFTLAVLNWPPAIFLFGVFGAFLFFILSLEFVRGHSPDHIAIPSVVAMVTTAILIIPFLMAYRLTPTDYSIAHVLLPLAVAAGAAFMAGVARLWERRELSRTAYPLGILGAGLVGVGILAVAAPDVLDFFISQLLRVAGLGTTDTAATIGEAQSPSDPIGLFYNSYGLGFYTALIGWALVLYRVVARKRPRADFLLIAVFGAFMLLFTLTQTRFEHYLVVAVAAGNAYIVGWIYQFVDLEDVREDIRNVKPYQVLIVIAILFVIAGPTVIAGSTAATADRATQPGEMQYWGDSLDWLSEETPEVGAYGTGDDPSLEYYGLYENREDYEYGDGEYGVIAWWDYGHYITTRGERVPVANPFQQNAGIAADFLLAGNETAAIDGLEEDAGEGEGVRYAMIDYQLGVAGTTKYNAPAAFDSRGIDRQQVDFGNGAQISTIPDIGILLINQEGGLRTTLQPQRAYESMRVRLYQHHGSAIEPSTNVLRFGESNLEEGWAIQPEGGDMIEQYNSSEAAAEAAADDPNAMHGGLRAPAERVEALEHFRMVHASEQTATDLGGRAPSASQSWVKTFERVDGATVEGTGPANTEVQASVEMEIPTTGETFVYAQYAETDAEGNFEMTLPYSTTGYDEFGPEEGYTNPSVRANGSYQFIAPDAGAIGQANVSEAQVIGEDDSPVTVELASLESQLIGDDADDSGESDVTDGDDTSGAETAENSRVVPAS
jgi:dolichyl-diphosphooligosaccharide--protein glycosyltransferase